ncbi:hypothetical protein GM418_14005 [Maribellus comscasis]|uniref:Uncharacterized protein n=1 Tax=Maribellus comscasis TaxID=2681766 RepID=A0A6I6JQN6_9BACT|nr:hypothetical protein [Maribellus comscasis]QGY44741.1 hypothetical protein GM418_14005 [Maribellus comscasis]
MKTVKTIISVLFFLFITQSLAAKSDVFKGDTIRYKFNKMLVEISSTAFADESPESPRIEEHIEQIQKILKEMTIATPAEDERIVISLCESADRFSVANYKDLKLTLEKKDSKNLIVFDDGTVFEKELGQYCIFFATRDLNVKIYVDDLADLSIFASEDFKRKAKEGTQAISDEIGKGYRKSPVQACVDLRENKPKVHVQTPSFRSLDMLYITGGVGSGWVKNSFVSDINFRLGLGFSRKGMIKNIYSVGWNMMYDFSGSTNDNFFELNHFVSVGWEHNFSDSPLQDKWYGLSVGYLAIRNNDFFKENTFRVSVKKRINDSVSLKPELYFNDFLKNIYPGIRVVVNF